MSDMESDDKISGGSARTLSLKGSGGKGVVRQNLSHGRSKQVVVETRKRKKIRPGDQIDFIDHHIEVIGSADS